MFIVMSLVIANISLRLVAQDAPDFGAGIDRFTQLGLPEVKNARYVKIKWSHGEYEFDRFSRGEGPKLEGNAWLIKETPGQNATVLVNEIKQMEVLHPKVMEQKQKEMMEKMQKQAEQAPEEDWFDEELLNPFQQMQRSGEWKDADLAKDAKTLIAWLGKAGDANPSNPGRELSDPRMFAMQFHSGSQFFLLAAHAYQKGMKTEANQIIALLFKRVGDNRKVVAGAMSTLADSQYAGAYEAFSKSGAWKQYLTDMETLLGRYPAAWRDRPVVEKVAASVRKHLAFAEPPPIPGEGLTEEDKKLADDLARDKKPINPSYQHHGPSWLLQANETPGIRRGAKAAKAAPMERILARKIHAIPLLIALLKDEYLLRVQTYPGMSSDYYSDDDEAMSTEEIDMRFEDFPRPVSRGEIARRLLAGLVLSDESRYDRDRNATPDEIARLSREWYDKHKRLSEKELLRQFLSQGKEMEQQVALSILMNSKDEADLKEVERYLLTPEKLVEHIDEVTNYARMRGAKAKAFTLQFLAKVRALPSLLPSHAGNVPDARYRKQMEDRARQQLKALEELTSDKTAEVVLKEMLAADKKWSFEDMGRMNEVLWSKLSQEEPAKALTLLLQTTIDAKDDTLAALLLQNVPRVQYMKLEQETALVRGRPKPVKLPIEKHADLWQRLMGQTRTSAGMSRYYGGGGSAPTFKQTVAMMVETMYAGMDENPAMMRRNMDFQALGDLVYAVYVQRAEARLAGKPEAQIPGFPDKSKVTEARRGEIRKQLAAYTPTDPPNFVAGLALDELLVLPDLVKEDPKLNDKLAPGAHIIRDIQVGITNDALKKLCQSFKDKPLDRKTLEALVEETKKLVKGGSTVMVVLSRSRPLGGLQLTVQPLPAQMVAQYGGMGRMGLDDEQAAPQGMVMAQLYAMSSGIHGNARWTVELPAKAPTTKAKGPDDDLLKATLANRFGGSDYLKRQEEQFWESFGKLLDPTRNVCEPYHCSLTGIVPQPANK